MSHHKINYIEIPAKNLIQTKKFFNDAFGWTFKDFGEEYTAIVNGGIDGGFFKSDLIASTKNGSMLVVLYSQNLEVTLEKLLSLKAKIIEPIFSFPGGRRFHFTDCSGNEFAVWSNNQSS